MPVNEINLVPSKDHVPTGPKNIIVEEVPGVTVAPTTPTEQVSGSTPILVTETNTVIPGLPETEPKKKYKLVTFKAAVARDGSTIDIVDTAKSVTLDQLEWKLASLVKQREMLNSLITETQGHIDTIKGNP